MSQSPKIHLKDVQKSFGPKDVLNGINIDVATGEAVFTKSLEEYRYPTMAGQHTSETTESRFRKLYLQTLAEEIGRSFHPYDMSDRFAADSRIASS